MRKLALVAPLLLLTAACSDSSSNEPGDTADVLLEPPERGVQYEIVTRIEPGAEVEHCKFVQVGDEDLFVNRDEIRFSTGSHHVLVFRTTLAEIPTELPDGRQVGVSEVFDCSEGPMSATGGSGFSSILAGSQNAKGDAMLSYPDDTAIQVEAGTVLMLNAHYINTTSDVLEPEARINLHTLAPEDVKAEGGIYFWYDPFIRVPARSAANANMACEVGADVSFTTMQSHMHARGVGFEAVLTRPDQSQEMLYEFDDWEGVPVTHLDPGLALEAGSSIRFDCQFDNPEERAVAQGLKTTDEMCLFFGSYYPKSDNVGFCFTDATWEGTGTATCADSLACLLAAQPAMGQGTEPGGGGFQGIDFEAMSGCILDASPAVAKPLSAAIGCFASGFFNRGEGMSTMMADCGEEIAACSAM